MAGVNRREFQGAYLKSTGGRLVCPECGYSINPVKEVLLLLEKYRTCELVEITGVTTGLLARWKNVAPPSLESALSVLYKMELADWPDPAPPPPRGARPSGEQINLLNEVENRAALEAAMKKLNPREADILSARFGLNGGSPKTLEELARENEVTKERIRQIEQKAIHKLKRILRMDDGWGEP